MRKRYRHALLLLLCLFLVAVPAAAQGTVVLRIDEIDANAFPSVVVRVTVRNIYGGPIAGLGPADFDVSEDRTLRPQPIVAVEPVTNPEAQVAVVLAIDVSGSMSGAKLRDAQEAARRFLDSLGPQDRVALIAFAGSVDLASVLPTREHGFDTDKTAIYRIVDGLQAGGPTPLYDAAYKAVRWAAAQPAGNRAVLLFTDGKEERAADGSGGSRVADDDTAIREANRAGVPIFTVGLGADADEGYLRRLALETGGVYQHASDSAELAVLFRNVSNLLKQQYRITYTSGLPADGQGHSVLVALRTEQATAFDEARVVAPYLPPTSTSTPSEPSSTDTPTAAPPLPEPTAPPAPSGSLLVVADISPTPTPPPSSSGPLGIAPIWWLVMAAAALAVGGLAVFVLGSMGILAIGRRSAVAPAGGAYRCLRCGHTLPDKDAQCPSCGYLGSYKEDT